MKENSSIVLMEIQKSLNKQMLNFKNEKKQIDNLVVCNCALKLLDFVFGEDNYSLPIDINAIYMKLNIPLYEVDLNSYMKNCGVKKFNTLFSKLSIRENLNTGEQKTSVYIEECISSTYQRYAMAYQLTYYILHKEQNFRSVEYYNVEKFSKDINSNLAELFAIFLLFPLPLYLDVFLNYVEIEMDSCRPTFRKSSFIEHMCALFFINEEFAYNAFYEIKKLVPIIFNYSNMEIQELKNNNNYDMFPLLEKRDIFFNKKIIQLLC